MLLYKHKNYKEYVAEQTRVNKLKLDSCWATCREINIVCDYFEGTGLYPTFGLCHGVRNGREVQWFRNALPECHVVGTEISETAGQFEHVIQHDFHHVLPEWINKVDFIYTNSLDHSYSPELALFAWSQCLTNQGVLVIQHSKSHDHHVATASDCFEASLDEYKNLIGNILQIEHIEEIAAKQHLIYAVKNVYWPSPLY